MVSQLRNFYISQSGVRFANGFQVPPLFIANGKGVVAQHIVPLAMAVFSAHHDTIQSRERLLQLQPGKPTAAWRITTTGILYHESFVPTATGSLERGLDLPLGGRLGNMSQAQKWRQLR